MKIVSKNWDLYDVILGRNTKNCWDLSDVILDGETLFGEGVILGMGSKTRSQLWNVPKGFNVVALATVLFLNNLSQNHFDTKIAGKMLTIHTSYSSFLYFPWDMDMSHDPW